MFFDGGTGHVLAKKLKAGRRSSFFDLWARRDEHFGLVCMIGLLRHWRHWPDFAGRSPARHPRLTVKLKPVAVMQAAARGQKVEAVIHEGKAGFFENTPRGNVVGARVGKNPVRPGETEDRVGERLDGFAREPFAAHLRRDNVAELDVPLRGQRCAKETYCLARAAFLGHRQDDRRSAGVAGTRPHDETLRLAWRVGMRNRRGHARDFGQASETRDRRCVGGARPAQPKPLGFDAEDVVGGQIREHAGSGRLARCEIKTKSDGSHLPFKTVSDFPPEFWEQFTRS